MGQTVDQHHHPRRRRAGWFSVVRADAARKALSFLDQATRTGEAAKNGGAGALPRTTFACGKNPLLPAGKTTTASAWWWQFLESKVGSFLPSAEDFDVSYRTARLELKPK